MLTTAGYPAAATSNRAGESSADVRSDSRTSLASTVILHSTTSFLTEHPTSAACQINRRAGLIPAVQRPHGTAAILASCASEARGVFPVRGTFREHRPPVVRLRPRVRDRRRPLEFGRPSSFNQKLRRAPMVDMGSTFAADNSGETRNVDSNSGGRG